MAHPQLTLRLACPSVAITLLHGSLYDDLPAMGNPALVSTRPWAVVAPPAIASTPVLEISLARGLDVQYDSYREAASCLDVDVPALLVTTQVATAPAPAPGQLRVVDLAGLRIRLRAFPSNCHWRHVPGLDAVLMGVGERSRDVAVSLQRLDLGSCSSQNRLNGCLGFLKTTHVANAPPPTTHGWMNT